MKTVQIKGMFSAFVEEQDDVTSIEYALLAALIFGAIVVAVGLPSAPSQRYTTGSAKALDAVS